MSATLTRLVTDPQFLYRCTTGLLDDKAQGCIMADEMGLGQCLVLSSKAVDLTGRENVAMHHPSVDAP